MQLWRILQLDLLMLLLPTIMLYCCWITFCWCPAGVGVLLPSAYCPFHLVVVDLLLACCLAAYRLIVVFTCSWPGHLLFVWYFLRFGCIWTKVCYELMIMIFWFLVLHIGLYRSEICKWWIVLKIMKSYYIKKFG